MQATSVLFGVLIVIWVTTFRKSDSLGKRSREDICLSAIPENYDRSLPALDYGEPTEVFLQMEILDLDEIDTGNMDFRLHAVIRTVWNDHRLIENRFSMNKDCLKLIWIPDLTFEKAKVIIDIGQEDIFFAVRDDHIYLTQRYSFKVMCKMDFHLYPFDTQRCKFSIGFMAADDSKAILKWFDDENSPYKNLTKPVLLSEDIEPLQFYIGTPTLHSQLRRFQFTNFTYIWTTIPLSRRLTGSLVNYYMPSTLLVVISWITFWLQGEATGERVTLIMTALLTICTQANQYTSELPPLNYITAMDIWFFVCTFLIFATLIEFAFSYNAYKKEKIKKLLKERESISFRYYEHSNFEEKNVIQANEGDKEGHSDEAACLEKLLQMEETTKLDSISKIVFPGFFITFFFTYWSYYLRM